MAKCIMVQGTCSNAGKSLLCAALCRIFRQDGYTVAPFKSQNMALNSFITADGKEMGRAQVVQAEAAGIAPDARMNPVLLKPTSDVGSQVIVMGEARGNRTAREYAPVLLVGDIDRGGVFASLYGTVKLLEEDEQARIRGLVINKFRGDVEILRPGLAQLEQLTGKPVVGVVPYGRFDIDDEDSLSERLDSTGGVSQIRIAVVRLPRLSNFTDFSALSRVPGVGVYYADRPAQLEGADLIILPGTKSTLGDLKWLRESGMEAQILKQHAAGTPVFGVCGGYQIMGQSVSDPEGAEGGGSLRGMGLLPTDTVFRPEKTTVQSSGTLGTLGGVLAPLSGMPVTGYEIHMGETTRAADAKPLVQLSRAGQQPVWDGCQTENAYGTYLHGVFDAPGVALALAQALAARKGITLADTAYDTAQYKEEQYDRLADAVRQSLDMQLIYRILEGKA